MLSLLPSPWLLHTRYGALSFAELCNYSSLPTLGVSAYVEIFIKLLQLRSYIIRSSPRACSRSHRSCRLSCIVATTVSIWELTLALSERRRSLNVDWGSSSRWFAPAPASSYCCSVSWASWIAPLPRNWILTACKISFII